MHGAMEVSHCLVQYSSLVLNSVMLLRNPLDKASTKDRAQYYVNLAKLAEKGKISSIFLTDGYGSHDVYEQSISANLLGGGHVGQLDPVVYVAPMALATKSVGIVVTGSSSYLSTSCCLGPIKWRLTFCRSLHNGTDMVEFRSHYRRTYWLEHSDQLQRLWSESHGA